MKKKLFKELIESIKQAGEIRKGLDVFKVNGYYVSWMEKIVVPVVNPKVKIEWVHNISGPHSEVVAKQLVDVLRKRGEDYAKDIIGLHYDAFDYVNYRTE